MPTMSSIIVDGLCAGNALAVTVGLAYINGALDGDRHQNTPAGRLLQAITSSKRNPAPGRIHAI